MYVNCANVTKFIIENDKKALMCVACIYFNKPLYKKIL